MLKRNRTQPAPRISIEKHVLILSLELISLLYDVMQIGFKNERPVLLLDSEGETALLLGFRLHSDVIPSDGGVLEGVDELAIAGEGEGE